MSDLARFDPPISTSNLVAPDRDVLMGYARAAYEGAPVTEWLEARLAAFHGSPECIALCSGFWALVLTIGAVALPGHTDVLMPSLTYRRMADVAAWCRLRPRFCEVEPETLACSARTMREAFVPEIGLFLAVHPIVGQCDAASLTAMAEEAGRPLLFDSVESVFERAGPGRAVHGGAAEVFSLHASKLLNGFEGGYVTTADGDLARQLRRQRDGIGPAGMDVRLNRLHAAMALASLDDLAAQVTRNRARYDVYRRGLAAIHGLSVLPFDEGSSFKTIVVELTEGWGLTRAETLRRLNGDGVLARAYYHPPLHAKPMAYPHVPASLPGTDRLAEQFMLLPCGHHVGHADIEAVVLMLMAMSA